MWMRSELNHTWGEIEITAVTFAVILDVRFKGVCREFLTSGFFEISNFEHPKLSRVLTSFSTITTFRVRSDNTIAT